jgi:predicted DNA-binding transcriptional regulator AlpA
MEYSDTRCTTHFDRREVMTQPHHEPYVGTTDTAAFLGKPKSWLFNNAELLGVPRYRIGNQWRYRLSEIAAWMEAHQ